MFSYNTIINFTELYKQERNPTALVLVCSLKSNIWFASTSYMWAMESLSARSVQIFVLMKIYM